MSWDAFAGRARRLAQSEPERGSKASALGAMVVLAAGMGVLVAAVLVPGTAFVAATANDVTRDVVALPMKLEDQPNPQTTRLLAADGSLLAYFYQENRQDIPLDQISENVTNAILAIEDSRFYEHGALDLKGTMRALVNNAADGRTQGGSTLTQQLVKLTLVQQATTEEQMRAATETSVARKIRELKLAIAYEEDNTKDEILERYLNIAYFGDGAYGVAAAAYHYFSTSPEELSVKQAATLAGLVQNPDEFNPRVFPERALQRRNTVLAVMARQGKVEQDVADQRITTGLDLDITSFPNGCVESAASFSCDYIRRYLLEEEALGADVEERRARLERGGLTIRSNIDVRMQNAVNEAVEAAADPTDRALGSMALVEPGTGKVRGVGQSRPMGADKDAGESYINFSVPRRYGDSGGFPAGSTFKMFTVAAALKEGIGPRQAYTSPQELNIPSGTYFDCEGGSTGPWRVSNSTSSGRMDMYRGTRESVNTYFAQLEEDAGLCNTVRAAEDMGIQVPFPDEDGNGINNQVPSFTLGVTDVSPLDMAAAYAVPAAGGEYCRPQPVEEILDSSGESIKEYESECKRVMDRDDAATINDILRGLQQPGGFGFARGTALDIPSAAKTGTTQDNKAVWYSGYTPEISAAAMIAATNNDGVPVSLAGTEVAGRTIGQSEAAGSALAGPMWKRAMGTIQTYLDGDAFDAPNRPQPARQAAGGGGGNDDD